MKEKYLALLLVKYIELIDVSYLLISKEYQTIINDFFTDIDILEQFISVPILRKIIPDLPKITFEDFINANNFLVSYGAFQAVWSMEFTANECEKRYQDKYFMEFKKNENQSIWYGKHITEISLYISKECKKKLYDDFNIDEHQQIDLIVFNLYNYYLEYLRSIDGPQLVISPLDYRSCNMFSILQ